MPDSTLSENHKIEIEKFTKKIESITLELERTRKALGVTERDLTKILLLHENHTRLSKELIHKERTLNQLKLDVECLKKESVELSSVATWQKWAVDHVQNLLDVGPSTFFIFGHTLISHAARR